MSLDRVPTKAPSPALVTRTSRPASWRRNRYSAVGLRQMFPTQSTRMCLNMPVGCPGWPGSSLPACSGNRLCAAAGKCGDRAHSATAFKALNLRRAIPSRLNDQQ